MKTNYNYTAIIENLKSKLRWITDDMQFAADGTYILNVTPCQFEDVYTLIDSNDIVIETWKEA